MIGEELKARTTGEWLELLQGADIPCMVPHTLDSVLDDPHLKDRGFFVFQDHPSEGRIRTMAEAILRDAWMPGAQLQDADFTQASLAGSRLIGASLRQTQLRGADLRNADLSDTDLTETDFSGANLAGAKLYGAKLVGTNLEEANLSGCCVYGVSTWDLRIAGAIQSNLVISRPLESPIQVDYLEVAQFTGSRLGAYSILNRVCPSQHHPQ